MFIYEARIDRTDMVDSTTYDRFVKAIVRNLNLVGIALLGGICVKSPDDIIIKSTNAPSLPTEKQFQSALERGIVAVYRRNIHRK